MQDEEKIAPGEQALREIFNGGVRQTIQDLMPWMRNNYEKVLAWFEATKRFETSEAKDLVRRFHRSRSWPEFKPDARDFVEWIKDREERQSFNRNYRKVETFGQHGAKSGALIMLHRKEFGKEIVRFGCFFIDDFGGEWANVWFPIKDKHRFLMGGRVWMQMAMKDSSTRESNWKVSFPGGTIPDAWLKTEKLDANVWPDGLRELYKKGGYELPPEAL